MRSQTLQVKQMEINRATLHTLMLRVIVILLQEMFLMKITIQPKMKAEWRLIQHLNNLLKRKN
jgi:hypothetical protein